MGLNALLTYAPITTATSQNSSSTTAVTPRRIDPPHSSTLTSLFRTYSPPHASADLGQGGALGGAGGQDPYHNMEKSLVSLVRSTIPLESLRELGEEIGLTQNDVQNFYKVRTYTYTILVCTHSVYPLVCVLPMQILYCLTMCTLTYTGVGNECYSSRSSRR